MVPSSKILDEESLNCLGEIRPVQTQKTTSWNAFCVLFFEKATGFTPRTQQLLVALKIGHLHGKIQAEKKNIYIY